MRGKRKPESRWEERASKRDPVCMQQTIESFSVVGLARVLRGYTRFFFVLSSIPGWKKISWLLSWSFSYSPPSFLLLLFFFYPSLQVKKRIPNCSALARRLLLLNPNTHTTQFRRLFSFLILPFASSSSPPTPFFYPLFLDGVYRRQVRPPNRFFFQLLLILLLPLYFNFKIHTHTQSPDDLSLSISLFIPSVLKFTKNLIVATRST